MDVRYARTDESIKTALLGLLAEKSCGELTMADVAREAGVSRSTLYVHFANVSDIFDALVRDFLLSCRGMRAQLRCADCGDGLQKSPFCMAVRAAGPYQPLVMAPEFLPTYLRLVLEGESADEALAPFLDAGVSESQARALFTFQMTGCYAAATMGADISWSDNQRALDQFIRGGLAALKSL